MKIAIITRGFPISSGEEFLADEIHELAHTGSSIVVVPMRATRNGELHSALPPGVTLERGAAMSFCTLARGLAYLLARPRTSGRIIRVLLSDRRHLWKNMGVLVPAAAAASRIEDVDHVHGHWLSTSGTGTMVISDLIKKPFSLTAHRWDIVDGNLIGTKVARARFLRVISQSSRELLPADIRETNSIRVVHMGVRVPIQPRRRRDQRTLRVIVPARLTTVKGHAHLLDAIPGVLASGLDVQFHLVGDGPGRIALEKHVERLGVGCHVTFEGHMPRHELLNWYASGRVDCVVLPSVDCGGGLHEGIPVSLMEAMSYGVCVISTRTGGIPELVKDGETGILVRAGDAGALVRAILTVFNEPELLKRLGDGGRQRVAECFNVERVAETMVQMISAGQ